MKTISPQDLFHMLQVFVGGPASDNVVINVADYALNSLEYCVHDSLENCWGWHNPKWESGVLV